MSVFAQYAPYELAEGTGTVARDEVAGLILDGVARSAPDIRDCIERVQVLGPPDIEERIGLTGGHIFQGEALPEQMWDRRLTWRTPVEGLYMCGAATHPGGSVIALNGRGAAEAVLDGRQSPRLSAPGPPLTGSRARGGHGAPAGRGSGAAAARSRMARSFSAMSVVTNAGWSCIGGPPGV